MSFSKEEIEKRVKEVVAELGGYRPNEIKNKEYLEFYLPKLNLDDLSRGLNRKIECVSVDKYRAKLYSTWGKVQDIIDGSYKTCNKL